MKILLFQKNVESEIDGHLGLMQPKTLLEAINIETIYYRSILRHRRRAKDEKDKRSPTCESTKVEVNFASKSKRMSQIVCNYCDKKGHIAAQCYKAKNDKKF